MAAFGSDIRAFWSAVGALSLTMTGSSVLPLPYTVAQTSVATFLPILAVVALMNVYSCYLLLKASHKTGTREYEQLAAAAGGKRLQIAATASMLLLLFGSTCGTVVVLADTFSEILTQLGLYRSPPFSAVASALGRDRAAMAVVTLGLLLPLSLPRRMRSLEFAAMASLPVLGIVLAVLAYDCIAWGFPGMRPGELSWVEPVGGSKGIMEAISILGFAFYIQPVLMPLLAEMPGGSKGLAITQRAVEATIFVYGVLSFLLTGFLGAAAFGSDTEGDIMRNRLLQSKGAYIALQVAVLFFVLFSTTPIILALRSLLEHMLLRKEAILRFSWASHAGRTLAIVGSALLVAMGIGSHSEVAFSVTGATGVSLVCYVVPVLVHISLWLRDKTAPRVCPSCRCVGYEAGALTPDPTSGCMCAPPGARGPACEEDYTVSVEPIPAGEATGVGAAADVPSDDAGRRGGEPGEGVAMGGREDCTEVGELPGQAGSEGALSSLEAASVGDCPDQPLLRTPFHVDGRWGGAVEGETGSREGVGRGVREGERGGRQLPAVVGPAVVGSQTSASLGADPLGGWKRLRGVGAGEVLLEVGLPVAMCTMGVVTGLITLYVTIALPAV